MPKRIVVSAHVPKLGEVASNGGSSEEPCLHEAKSVPW